MTTTTVTNVVTDATGAPLADVQVLAFLYPLGTPAFAANGDELFNPAGSTHSGADGRWSLSLERTDTMTPTGMVYQITEAMPNNTERRVNYLVVPAGGGTLAQLLTMPPPSVASVTGMDLQLNTLTAVGVTTGALTVGPTASADDGVLTIAGPADPLLAWYNSGAPADQKRSRLLADASGLFWQFVNDANSVASNVLQVTRRGTDATAMDWYTQGAGSPIRFNPNGVPILTISDAGVNITHNQSDPDHSGAVLGLTAATLADASATGDPKAFGIISSTLTNSIQAPEWECAWATLKRVDTAGVTGNHYVLDLLSFGTPDVQQSAQVGTSLTMVRRSALAPRFGAIGQIIWSPRPGDVAATEIGNQTYPLDIGHLVSGRSGTSLSDTPGFAVAYQAGGAGVGPYTIPGSHIGTGFYAQDYDVAGVRVGPAFGGATSVPGLDLHALPAAAPLFAANLTDDTPATTWTAGVPSQNPVGVIKGIFGGSAGYIPVFR